MKKIVLAALALTIGIAGLQAQDKTDKTQSTKPVHGKHYGKHGKHGKHNAGFKALNLTQDQQAQIKKVNADFKSKMDELKKSEATITVKDYKAKKQAIAKQHREQVQNILTKEQKDQLAKMRSERGKKFAGRHGQGMDKMKTALGLSDEQSAKIKTLQADTRSKIKAIRENQTLSDDQKKQQVMASIKDQRESMHKILTPEQLKKMESMRSKHMNREAK